MTQPGWPEELVLRVAREVRRRRDAAGISAQDLADATEHLGHPIGRSVLANLENGRRTTLSIADLVVLARALNVSPILLLFPVGRIDQVEIPLGIRVDTWSAVQWFAGEVELANQFLTSDGKFHAELEAGGVRLRPITLYRQHSELLDEWERATSGAQRARRAAETAGDNEDQQGTLRRVEALEREAFRLEGEIAKTRREMRRENLKPPRLSSALYHVDKEADA